jgi:RND family efflux transporter MFP subunit
MKKFIVILIIVAILAVIVYRVASHGKGTRTQSISEIQKEKGVPVEVVELKPQDLNRTLNFTGTVEGLKQADACAKISEKIVELNVEIGDKVTANQVLAKLDPSSPQVQISQAQLAAKDAEREYQRAKNLFEQGALSRQVLEKAQMGYEIAVTNAKQVEELITIFAPISGIVTNVQFHIGETPGPGSPVITIAEMSNIKIKMDIASTYRDELKRGQTAYIYLSSAPEKRIKGYLDKISLSADPESRNYLAYANAGNAGGYFDPGVSVEVEIVVGVKKGVLVVPREAIFTSLGKSAVYIADEKAHKTSFKPGISNGNLVEVLEGLQTGQKVVVHGQNQLEDGDLVLIVN